MLRMGHYGCALLIYAPLASGLVHGSMRWMALGGIPVVLLLARLPDVDRRLPWVTHRGLTHTIWFAAITSVTICYGIASILGRSATWSVETLHLWGFLLPFSSLSSHLLGDAITPLGIRPLYPVSEYRLSLDLVRSGNSVVNYLLLGLGVLAILLVSW